MVVSSLMPRTFSINCGYFSCISTVRSPPSSRIMLGCQPLGPVTVCSMHHQNSSSLMPFQAKTGMPAAAIAAAAWSWVEKMLHDDQRTSAPSSISVSISTAVWIVMCRQPAMRAPFSGFRLAELGAQGHQPRHLGLGYVDLFAAPLGEAHILDFVIAEGGRHSGLLEIFGKRCRVLPAEALARKQGMQTHDLTLKSLANSTKPERKMASRPQLARHRPCRAWPVH